MGFFNSFIKAFVGDKNDDSRRNAYARRDAKYKTIIEEYNEYIDKLCFNPDSVLLKKICDRNTSPEECLIIEKELKSRGYNRSKTGVWDK